MFNNIEKDKITKVEIDDSGKLHIKPEKSKFTMIYRTATEVHWDDKSMTLYSPKPRDWSYLDWFLHIVGVAKNECSVTLKLTDKTEWINITDELKVEITKAQQKLNFMGGDEQFESLVQLMNTSKPIKIGLFKI